MNLKKILESSKQIKGNRKSEYGRIRLAGENVRMHRAVKGSGRTAESLRNLKNKPKEQREKEEKEILSRIKSKLSSSNEIDHKNGNKKDNTSDNLDKKTKADHTAKTNKTR